MNTNYNKGFKIYYFQTSDGKEKISSQREENGFEFANYKYIANSIFGNK